ncbi:hypothetical protein [Nocardioides sp. CER19]|uniref:hypothetical protein n=1 Tax=Nocardioides sp. CER19 TaxID=3038538 RepID=UPI00244B546D|nr:hypothetical protein [Nocardioides sp. CER19]MDH2415223.1 hypothetical protein [Nocardioides sp. CER19]
MEILLWLVPPAVVTVLAMLWVGWLGREGRGEVDRDTAVRRMGEALSRPPRPQVVVRRQPRERSTGVAVRAPRVSPESTDGKAS